MRALTLAIFLGAATAAAQTVPPIEKAPPAPVYPAAADGRPVVVNLILTIDAQGQVVRAVVEGKNPADAPASFDEAAIAAAQAMTFVPATRDGAPQTVRVRYQMTLAPPLLPDAGPPDAPPAQPPPEPAAPPPAEAPPAAEVTLRSRAAAPSRGASDFIQEVGGLRHVPVSNASDILRLAPGILLTNEGGEGHAETVFLRGFDAGEGQDIEFTVEGVPINEVGNPHGEGYADTHFIIPELVRSIRVLEGPFDPHQGNYAVAGSADYQLGLEQRGLTLGYQGGSFNTHRLLALWGPEGEAPGTFAGVDLKTTDGFGQNRAARYGRAMGGLELILSPTLTLRLLATSYATRFGTAGVVREDDVESGKIGFDGTYDATQGGDVSRHGVSVTLEDRRPDRVLSQQVFATLRDLRLRFNFTGFLTDPPAPWRSGLDQRGDETDQTYQATTVGGRGSLRLRKSLFGQLQSIEAGYYGRYDRADSAQRRNRFGTIIPYKIDYDLGLNISNIGMYVDTELRPLPFLTLRGGLRGDYFHYDVLSRCDTHDSFLGSATPIVDELCYDKDRIGPRDPSARRSASGTAFQPRATAIVGPFSHLSFAAAVGKGARAADPSYLGDGNDAPFASIFATEGGILWDSRLGDYRLSARALYYYTFVGQDLIFNQQQGRNTLAPGTRRQGVLAAARLTGPWLDANVSATYAHAVFDRTENDPGSTFFPPDTGNRVPFISPLVIRGDGAVFGPLPWSFGGGKLRARAALGVSYVAPRPLLFNETGDTLFVVDASAGVGWRNVEVGIIVENLFDSRYRLSEYNFASEFNQGTQTPNLLPVRHFSAGPPLSVLGTLTFHFGPEP